MAVRAGACAGAAAGASRTTGAGSGSGAGREVISARSSLTWTSLAAVTLTEVYEARSISRPAAGMDVVSRTAGAEPWAGRPMERTSPEAAATTAAWRPTVPALEDTACDTVASGLERTGVARWRAMVERLLME